MTQTLKQRMILDHHTQDRQRFIKMEAKRQRSIEILGKNHVLHPENPNRPRKGSYNNFGLPVLFGRHV